MVLAELPEAPLLVLAGVLGLLFGSFTNVVIHRVPLEQSVVFPPSRCPGCGSLIRPVDNVPVLSWLLLRGKARCCGARISPRYPLVEVLVGLWAVAATQMVLLDLPGGTNLGRVGLLFAAYLALGVMLIAALFIDLDHLLLPDPLTLGAAGVGLASLPLREISWQHSLAAGAGAYLVVRLLFVELYSRLRGHPGMGLGDAKLLMAAGVWFGWPGALFALMAGSVFGSVTALAVMATGNELEEPEAVARERQELQAELEALEGEERRALEAEIAADPVLGDAPAGFGGARLAFGPFLVAATLLYALIGPALLQWAERSLSL